MASSKDTSPTVMKRNRYLKPAFASIVILLIFATSLLRYFSPSDSSIKHATTVNYATDIKPILLKKCFDCHTEEAPLPFYYNFPILHGIIDDDRFNAIEAFDMSDDKFILGSLRDFLKLERILRKNIMPPLSYKLINWGSGLSSKEKSLLLDWIDLNKERITAEIHKDDSDQDSFKPINLPDHLNQEVVNLGRDLFHEKKLSGNDSISCATCHNLMTGGVDNMPVSVGINGNRGERNAPTVFNSGFNFRQFWDGRAKTLEDQIDGPTHNPKEMGSDWNTIVNKLKADQTYQKRFIDLFTDGLNARNIKIAIATFERSLVTPSRFDAFLRGDSEALNAREKEGFALFKKLGCATCHNGSNLGGSLFEKLGEFAPYFEDKGKTTESDLGRYNITGKEKDKYKFKVPSLRNVAVTYPYFHDGSVATLNEAVSLMGYYQIGRKLSAREIEKITAFLHTLTGVNTVKPANEGSSP